MNGAQSHSALLQRGIIMAPHISRLALASLGLAFWLAHASATAQEPKQPGGKKGDKVDTKKADDKKKIDAKVKEIAGSAEFLGGVPKHFATLKAVDVKSRQVTLLVDGEVL